MNETIDPDSDTRQRDVADVLGVGAPRKRHSGRWLTVLAVIVGLASAFGLAWVVSRGITRSLQRLGEAAQAIGYFQEHIHAAQRDAVIDLFATACEPLRHPGAYDFGTSDLPLRLRDAGLKLSMERDFWHTPPADALFLHRKLGGLYLLAARLRARVDVATLAAQWLE